MVSKIETGMGLVEPFERCAPASALSWADVLELTKLRLNSMVLVTALTGYVLAAGALTDGVRILNLLIGLALAAAGAAMLNQYVERDSDRLMKRTANRPLPAGRIKPAHVLWAGVAVLAVGLSQLALFINMTACLLCLLTAASYLLLYTPLKKKTPLCTIVGAIPGALPPMIGWVAATGELGMGGWVLFSILFMWQLPHFFSIAWIYRSDYAAAGQPMISLIDEDGRCTAEHMIMCQFTLVLVSLFPVVLRFAGALYLAAAVVLGAGFVILGIRFWWSRTAPRARAVLFGSLLYLPGILTMWLIDAVGP